MAGRGLKADRATINALARKIEGNLLAAVQEIDRLALQALDGVITQDMIEAAVTDQARFDVYQWLDAALAGQTLEVYECCVRWRPRELMPLSSPQP